MVMSFGIVLFENSIGLFLLMKEVSFADCVKRIIRIPTTYAFITGFLLKGNVYLPEDFDKLFDLFTNVYVFLGIVIIGMNLSKCKISEIVFTDLLFVIFFKPIIWVSFALLYIYLDKNYFQMYSLACYKILLIIAIVPAGANLVSWCEILSPSKSSIAYLVAASTFTSILYATYILKIL